MKELMTKHWEISNISTLKDVDVLLNSNFEIEKFEEECNVTLYDDEDWGLWQSESLLLFKQPGELEYYAPGTKITLEKIRPTNKFWWDIPSQELQNELKAKIKLRALQARAKYKIHAILYHCLNEDKKITVKIRIVMLSECEKLDKKKVRSFLVLQPLRGYESEAKSVEQTLKAKIPALVNVEQLGDFDERLIALAAGLNPSPTKIKKFGIADDEEAEKTVRKMSRLIFGLTKKQTPGIISDIDTEYLHDYRVYLRKARSLVTLMKKSLDEQSFLVLKENFTALANPTNTLRDLDVFLLDENYYKELLPDTAATGLEKLLDLIQKQRKKEFTKVSGFIKSAEFQNTIKILDEELDKDPSYTAAFAKAPIAAYAKSNILKRYKRICSRGAGVDDKTPDVVVHDIRKDCKKLRYMMEFFAELFPKKRLKNLVDSLKKLQNILGRFNDVSVQQEFLQPYTDLEKCSSDVVTSVSGLIAVLHHQQLEERKKVKSALRDFSEDEVSVQFQLLFS